MTADEPGSVRTISTLRAADGKGVVRLEDRFDTDVHVEDLAGYLAGRERCDARARWQELHPAYQQLVAAIA